MNHHHHNHHDPPPIRPAIGHKSAAQIMKNAARFLISHPLTFIFIISMVFNFRYNVENGARYLISFVDSDPSLKSLISRLDLAGNHQYQQQQHRQELNIRRRRRAFLHLSRVGTLDEDFFSGDDDYERSLFNPSAKAQPNATSLHLSSPADPDFIGTIRHGFISFRAPLEPSESPSDVQSDDNATYDDSNAVVDLQFLLKGLELGRKDTSSLLYFMGVLGAAYGYVILAFLVTYTWVNGIVFYSVLNDLLGKSRNTFRTLWEGSGLGLRRLCGFVLMRWAVRDALAQLMGIYFFGEIDDQYKFFKIFMRMKLMPFSDTVPWVSGYEKESLGFAASWFLIELVVSFMFSVDTWVAVVDSRKSGREVVKEGCHLLATLLYPAVEMKCWELILCGWSMRWLLRVMVGDVFALLFIAALEVHFMVAWLLFYLAARHRDAALTGREFGQREMEVFLEGAR